MKMSPVFVGDGFRKYGIPTLKIKPTKLMIVYIKMVIFSFNIGKPFTSMMAQNINSDIIDFNVDNGVKV